MITKSKTKYPVSLDEVKSHLRIDASISDDDTYITNQLIKSATRKAENFIDKDIAYTLNNLIEYDWGGSCLEVQEGNFKSITDISLNGTLITSYTTEKYDDKFVVDFDNYIGGIDYTLSMNFFTGYDTSTDTVPEDIKQAILIECGHLYDVDRSSYVANSIKKTDAFERLLLPYKTIRW